MTDWPIRDQNYSLVQVSSIESLYLRQYMILEETVVHLSINGVGSSPEIKSRRCRPSAVHRTPWVLGWPLAFPGQSGPSPSISGHFESWPCRAAQSPPHRLEATWTGHHQSGWQQSDSAPVSEHSCLAVAHVSGQFCRGDTCNEQWTFTNEATEYGRIKWKGFASVVKYFNNFPLTWDPS